MTKPLQIWLPALNSTLPNAVHDRDAKRALEIWDGETTVWLLPDLDKKTSWWEDERRRRAVAIPAEHLERIDVYHMGAEGYVVGRGAGSLFPKSRVQDLLDAWLTLQMGGALDLCHPPTPIYFERPLICDGKVTYIVEELEAHPTGLLPFVGIDEPSRTVKMGWPPKDKHFSTVSPDAESEELFGPFVRTGEEGAPTWTSADGEHKTAFWFLRWPEPFASLIPAADGLDIALGQHQMAMTARQSAEDPSGALMHARQLARTYVFDGHSSRKWTWFLPTSLGEGDEALVFKAEDHGFSVRSPDDFFTNPQNLRLLNERIPIRRAWGPLGLFWALLLAQLEEHKPFRVCANCHRILRGQQRKKYCSPGDDQECFNKRRKIDQRRSRQQRRVSK
jgi:hypothetical protein